MSRMTHFDKLQRWLPVLHSAGETRTSRRTQGSSEGRTFEDGGPHAHSCSGHALSHQSSIIAQDASAAPVAFRRGIEAVNLGGLCVFNATLALALALDPCRT